MNKDAGTAGVIAPPPLILLAALIAGFVLDWLTPLGLRETVPAVMRHAAGGVFLAAALIINFMGAGRFGRERTPVNPYRPPSKLVTGGIFAVTRNPMYVGFYLLAFALALLFAAGWLVLTTIIAALVIHYGVVLREERYLESRFGEEYLRYKEKVPRYVGF
jgi:protein-S-isoprenylcysteine O-methyltransferase Ste14